MLDAFKSGSGVLDERGSRLRRGDTAVFAQQQPDAGLRLQGGDVLRHRRLREMQLPDGTVSSDAEEQLRQIWSNIEAVLTAAAMELRHLVHVRTYLGNPDVRGLNTAVRRAVLGDHRPALTVVICTLFEPDWVAEIEAIAYRDDRTD